MPNFSKRIVYLTEAQRKELFLNETITVDGVTIDYDENDIYVTPQEMNMSIGTVTTLPSSGNAAASISGDPEDMTLDLSLPRGESGVYIGSTAPSDPDINVWIDTSEATNPYIETITATDPVIAAEANCRYMCGEVYSISITPPDAGTTDVVFTSGATPAVLTLPATVKMPEWWNGTEANRTYEICIMDGVYVGVMSWPA